MNVVSFFAPRPEHPFFQDYNPFLKLLDELCRKFGHHHIVLTDDAAAIESCDMYQTPLPRSLMKATIAAQLAYLSDPKFVSTPTLLTGADCVLANDPSRAMGDFDIGITTGEFADCRMNCGAIFVPRPGNVAFIWARALANCGDVWGDDQTSLYAEIRKAKRSGLWVKEYPVDPYNLAPEHPGDDCRRGVVLHFRGPRKAWMASYCHHWLSVGEGFTAVALPNITASEALANVRSSIARGLPEVSQGACHDGHAILVGGGPSLAETLNEIVGRRAQGHTIFALNGAAGYLRSHGIEPDYGVMLDARAENKRFIIDDVPWLLASQCAPEVFDAAAGDASVWHFHMDGIVDIIGEGRPRAHGGVTVGITALSLVFMMGYRNIDLFGYDSSDREDAAHAYTQTDNEAISKRITVWCGGKSFSCGIAMYAQAEMFERWARCLTEHGAIIAVHGDGLLPTIAHAMSGSTLVQEEQAA